MSGGGREVDELRLLMEQIDALDEAEEARREAFDDAMKPLRDQLAQLRREKVEAHLRETGQIVLREGDRLHISQSFITSKSHQQSTAQSFSYFKDDWALGQPATVENVYCGPNDQMVRVKSSGGGLTSVPYKIAQDMRKAALDAQEG